MGQSAQSNAVEDKVDQGPKPSAYPGADPGWQHFLLGGKKPAPEKTAPNSERLEKKKTEHSRHTFSSGTSDAEPPVRSRNPIAAEPPSFKRSPKTAKDTPRPSSDGFIAEPSKPLVVQSLPANPQPVPASGLDPRRNATTRLQDFFQQHENRNVLLKDSALFSMGDSVFATDIALDPVIVGADPSIRLFVDSVWMTSGGKQQYILPSYYSYRDSGDLHLEVPARLAQVISPADVFEIEVRFKAECIVEGLPAYLKGSQYFVGKTHASLHTRPGNGVLFQVIMITATSILGLFFLITFLVARRPVSSLKYLQLATYRPLRTKRATENAEIKALKVDPVAISAIKNGKKDLIQLAWSETVRPEIFVTGERGQKVFQVRASVPTPVVEGFMRHFRRIYARQYARPRFAARYHSLRVEVRKSELPVKLETKNEAHLFLLGTSLSGAILANDHQNFKIEQQEFNYSIFLDPAEIVDYHGSFDGFVIPFRVIEEPWEGYTLLREFELTIINHHETLG